MLKRALALVALVFALFPILAIAQVRIEWPWGGEWRGSADTIIFDIANPFKTVNIIGVPTHGDVLEYVLRNPDKIVQVAQNPTNLPYLIVANAIISSRNAVVANGGRAIPANVRAALRGFYPDSLLDSVRWSTNWNLVQNTLQAVQMFENRDTQAITLINAIVFRDSNFADDVLVWAHELHHVKQYEEWGVNDFAERWVNNSSTSGPIEEPAYATARAIGQALYAGKSSVSKVKTGADCKELNNSMAYCDLYAANGGPTVTFTADGDAKAAGDGTQSGSMQLVMVARGNKCNAGADEVIKVDHDSEVSGPRYSCQIDVKAGETLRVMAVAPNNRADAVFTRITATAPDPSTSKALLIYYTFRNGNKFENGCEARVMEVVRPFSTRPGEGPDDCELTVELRSDGTYVAGAKTRSMDSYHYGPGHKTGQEDSPMDVGGCFVRAQPGTVCQK